MKIDSKKFRLAVCAALMAASTLACSEPGKTPGASASPGQAAPGQATPAPEAAGTPVELKVTEVKAGDGASVDGAAAYDTTLKIWSDKFGGKPFGRGEMNMIMVPEFAQMPGLIDAAKGMKVGGVKNVQISIKDLFGELPENAKLQPNTPLYIEMTVKDVFPKEDFKIETVKPGSGDKAAAKGDIVSVHYVGRLKEFDKGEVFDSSRERGVPFTLTLGNHQVITGWEEGLLGMKKGEVRRLSIPHYLAYGTEAKGKIPAKSRLLFEVELVDFVTPGELKQETTKQGTGDAIASGTKGSFHYTGWLDGFNGKEKFDSSKDRNEPIDVVLGQGQVIQGWDQGLVGMKPGEVRRLTIPYNLAYGPSGRPPAIPGYATLYFEVEYVGPAKEATPAPAAPATPAKEAK